MGFWRGIMDWIFIGTDTEPPTPDELQDADPLAGDRDGLGNIAASEDDRGTGF